MAAKEIRFGTSAREKMLRGVDDLTNAVKVKVGIDVVRRAALAPTRQIAENAGVNGSIVVNKLLEQEDTNFGFDAQTGEYRDLVTAGIVDPTKVVRTALQEAASVGGLLITTEAMVAQQPEPEPRPQAPAHADMGF
jgi:chaperonin GroEL